MRALSADDAKTKNVDEKKAAEKVEPLIELEEKGNFLKILESMPNSLEVTENSQKDTPVAGKNSVKVREVFKKALAKIALAREQEKKFVGGYLFYKSADLMMERLGEIESSEMNLSAFLDLDADDLTKNKLSQDLFCIYTLIHAGQLMGPYSLIVDGNAFDFEKVTHSVPMRDRLRNCYPVLVAASHSKEKEPLAAIVQKVFSDVNLRVAFIKCDRRYWNFWRQQVPLVEKMLQGSRLLDSLPPYADFFFNQLLNVVSGKEGKVNSFKKRLGDAISELKIRDAAYHILDDDLGLRVGSNQLRDNKETYAQKVMDEFRKPISSARSSLDKKKRIAARRVVALLAAKKPDLIQFGTASAKILRGYDTHKKRWIGISSLLDGKASESLTDEVIQAVRQEISQNRETLGWMLWHVAALMHNNNAASQCLLKAIRVANILARFDKTSELSESFVKELGAGLRDYEAALAQELSETLADSKEDLPKKPLQTLLYML